MKDISKDLMLKVFFGLLIVAVLGLISFNFKNSFLSIQKSNESIITKNFPGLIAWGSNVNGQLGLDFAPSQDPLAIKIPTVKSVAAGQNHSLGLTSDGQVLIWGNNKYGQLGRSTPRLYDSNPTTLQKFDQVSQIAAKSNHTLLLKEDGSVWAFGSNFTGQLGDGTNTSRNQPAQVPNLDHIREIASGYKFSLAVKDDNTLWAWGTSCDPQNQNEAKKLLQDFAGNLASLEGGYYDSGSSTDSNPNQSEDCLNEDIIGIKSNTPKQIVGLDNIKDVSGGYGHVLALKNDNTVWSFGCNHFEQLGLGPDKHSLANATPNQIQGLPPIEMVSAGFRHSLVLTKDGEVFTWGHNQFGELGNGTTSDPNPNPQKIQGLSDVVFIAAGFDYSLVIKKDDTVWGWGTNNYKQLGKDVDPVVTKPIQLKGLNNINYVAAGGAHVLALAK